MDTGLIERVTQIAPFVISGVALGFAVEAFRTWKRRAEWAIDEAIVAIDLLSQMEIAQDPGRTVHERLAAAMEGNFIRAGMAEAPVELNPVTRRMASYSRATDLIMVCQRANLVIVPAREEAT